MYGNNGQPHQRKPPPPPPPGSPRRGQHPPPPPSPPPRRKPAVIPTTSPTPASTHYGQQQQQQQQQVQTSPHQQQHQQQLPVSPYRSSSTTATNVPQQRKGITAATSAYTSMSPQQQQQRQKSAAAAAAAPVAARNPYTGYGSAAATAGTTTSTTASSNSPYIQPRQQQQHLHHPATYAIPPPAVHSPYGYAATATTTTTTTPTVPHKTSPSSSKYQHNTVIAIFLLPTLYLTTVASHASSSSTYPTILLGMSFLLLYALDLANQPTAIFYTVWCMIPLHTMVNGWFWLIQVDKPAAPNDSDSAMTTTITDTSSGWVVLEILFQMAMTALLWIAVACWVVLQLPITTAARTANHHHHHHNNNNTNHSSWARPFQACLHTLVPTVSGSLGSHFLVQKLILQYYGIDVAATAAPLVFATCLATSMLCVGSCCCCYSGTAGGQGKAPKDDDHNDNDDGNSNNSNHNHNRPRQRSHATFCISPTVAFVHVAMLLLVPSMMHFMTFYRRIWSSYAALDDWCDWILSFSVPYLMLVLIGILHQADIKASPYGALRLVATQTSGLVGVVVAAAGGGGVAAAGGGGVAAAGGGGVAAGQQRTFAAAAASKDIAGLLPFGMTVITSLAVQQRYLIPAVHRLSYMFMGVYPSSVLLSLYWTVATLALLFAIWLWGRKSAVTGQLLFGEYQEDVVQLSLALTGMAMGKGVGMPWNFTPLPILAFLGLSLWLSTRMLRYLAIFLFVIHAAAFVTFTYRFAGMTHIIQLSFPEIPISLVQFGMIVISSSILVGLVTGMAVRSTGGFLATTLKKIDFTGFLLIFYTMLLLDLEMTLFRRDAPASELSGLHVKSDDNLRQGSLYSFALGAFTSATLVATTLFMKRVHILSSRSAGVVLSMAIGKCAMFYAESVSLEMGIRSDVTFLQTVVVSIIFMILFTPSVFLSPVHLKTSSRYKRSLAGDSGLPGPVTRTLVLYNLIFLPLVLMVAIECLQPVYFAFQHQGGGSFSISLSLVFSVAVALWSIASLSMLNHYLPDGGGEFWKKFSALAFLFAVIIFFVTSPLRATNIEEMASNPYVIASSIGGKLQSRSKRRNGIWGISSAVLATILAMTGVLELKEKRSRTGVKDRFLMFRTMIFSLMFGGGVTWFIVVQMMIESEPAFLILTMVSSMTLACLGTVTAVLGHFIELEHFDEAEELGKTWFFALPLFLPVAGLPQLFSSPAVHMFEAGGWLSTYLTVCGLTAFSISTSLRMRGRKDTKTHGQNNLFCVTSWVCAVMVLFGRFGVAGLDSNYDVTTVFGIPSSVIGTLAASLVLLGLEGESTSTGRRISASGSSKPSTTTWSLPLLQLKTTNRVFPPFFASTGVLLLAAVYAILLRGSWLLVLLGGSIPKSREDIFASVVDNRKMPGLNQELAALAQETIRQSTALYASAQLASSGFWTSTSFFRPLIHLAGVAATLPSLLSCTQKWWMKQSRSVGTPQFQRGVPLSLLTLTTALNLFPILLCHGIACLRAAACLCLVAGSIHVVTQKRSDQASRMQL